MRDPWKPTWQEWLGLALIPSSIFVIVLGIKFSVHRVKIPIGPEILLYMLPGVLPMIAGVCLLIWYGGKRAEERYKFHQRDAEAREEHLRRIKDIYPPNGDVYHHLHQLGYSNVTCHIYALERVLKHVSGNYRYTLAGKPVRDADESLAAAEKLVGK